MTDPHYQLLPYARTALASSAGDAKGVRLQGKLSVRVGRSVLAGGVATEQRVDPVDVTVSLYGPGDAVGIDRGQLLRTVPEADDWDVEPNYLAAVELDAPELPWLLTPQLPANGRLAPWIVLVVVPDGPGVIGSATGCAQPVLRADPQELPDLSQSWAWAHVQILSDRTDSAALQAMLADRAADGSTLSRLVCPRRLEPYTRYVAAIVPAFAAGVAAAGLDIVAGMPDAPAWSSDSRSPVRLPIYHSWHFGTGAPGDFESLARLLHPVRAADVPGLGRRSMVVVPADVPGGADTEPYLVTLRSALTTTEADPDVPGPGSAVEEAGLEALLNAGARLSQAGFPDPVGPPVYGEWLAGRRTVDRSIAEPRDWLNGLNVVPAGRVAAGAGADVVRTDQEELMAKAWDQVRDVDRANEKLRWTQLSLLASRRLCSTRIDPRTASSTAQLCRPAATKLPFTVGAPVTVAERLARSPLPGAALDSAYTKVSLRAARRAQVTGARLVGELRGRMLGEEAVLAPPRELAHRAFADAGATRAALAESGGLTRIVAKTGLTAEQTFEAVDELPELLAAVRPAGLVRDLTVRPDLGQRERVDVVVGGGVVGGMRAARISASGQTWLDQARPHLNAVRDSVALPDRGVLARAEIGVRFSALAERRLGTVDGDNLLAQRIGRTRPAPDLSIAAVPADAMTRAIAAIRDRIMLDDDSPPPATLSVLPPQELNRALVAALAPERTLRILAEARIKVDDGLVSRGVRRLFHPIMVAPRFTEPVAGRLRDAAAQQHLLANAQSLEPNGITLLTTNPRFVEALMVGVNHEMARELLYRGYPTDRQGTCFRQFWARLDGQEDISPITGWGDGALGTHGLAGLGGNLVVLLRGDLLRRYPRTVVTARKGKASPAAGGKMAFVEDPAVAPRRAIFGDRLPPDMAYAGLDLTAAEADQDGWFILLEQPPTEPRFGLDVAASDGPVDPPGWNDVTWQHAAAGGHLSAAPDGLDTPATPGGLAWGVDAAQTAAILLQQPFRLALPTAGYLAPATARYSQPRP